MKNGVMTQVEAVRILTKMLYGEDVEKYYTVEKMCTQACNFLRSTWSSVYCFTDRFRVDTELREAVDELMKAYDDYRKRAKDCDSFNTKMVVHKYSVRQAEEDRVFYPNVEGLGTPYVSASFAFRSWFPTGTFYAYPTKTTNTKKNQAFEEAKKLLADKIDDVTKYFGLYSSTYIPGYLRVNVYTLHTEVEFKSTIDEINKILAGGESFLNDQATDKQVLWIEKKLGIKGVGNKLNKYQASELLDVLFKGAGNAAGSDPDEVIAHYKNILNIQESRNKQIKNNITNMKQLVRLTESDLHRIVKESVTRILNEIGDTDKGNFLVNAVRGKLAARRWRTNMGVKARAENDRKMGLAMDTAWKNFKKNPALNFNDEEGYLYGFNKEAEKLPQ